jgi:hypothetical protein
VVDKIDIPIKLQTGDGEELEPANLHLSLNRRCDFSAPFTHLFTYIHPPGNAGHAGNRHVQLSPRVCHTAQYLEI